MNKRGISAVVATVLIVLLVVGSVAIFWGTVMPLIVKSGDEIGTEQFLLNLKIVDDSVRLDRVAQYLQRIQIKRKAGKGALSGMKLVLIGADGNSMVYPPESFLGMKELETYTFNFVDEGNGILGIDYSEIGVLVKIRVAPVWEVNRGKEKVGNPTDEYKMTGAEYSLGCFGSGGPNGRAYCDDTGDCISGTCIQASNGIYYCVEAEETCDDGDDIAGTCNGNCEYTTCGDGTQQQPNGELIQEVCDLGDNNGVYGFACNSACTSSVGPYCGDGYFPCNSGVDCSGDQVCNFEEYCVDEDYEVCDDGSDNDEQTECDYGNPTCSICDATCENIVALIGPYCGDNNVDEEESCDVGEDNTNTCETNYQLSCGIISCAYCSDGTNADEEECEPVGLYGACCGDGFQGCMTESDCFGIPDATCETFGDFKYCIQEEYEECDAGSENGAYGSGCNLDCSGVGPYCGDEIINSIAGETCDDGTDHNTNTCTPTYPNGDCTYCSNGSDGNQACTIQTITAGYCGDGSYPCEDGGDCSGDQVCSIQGYCVDDGFEQCDDGDSNNNDGCIIDEQEDIMCVLATCGDGYLWNEEGGSETCDPGLWNACGMASCCPAGTLHACRECYSGGMGSQCG